MTRHKVLIVTPFAIEPEVEGNRRRIKVLANQLAELGVEVHVALLPLKLPRSEEVVLMQATWGKSFHLLPPKYPSSLSARTLNKSQRLGYFVLDRFIKTRWSHLPVNGADEYYFRWWNARLYFLQRAQKFDAVFAEYIFMSRAFGAFDDSVLKVIDTHDVFANRNTRISASGLSYKWWSVIEADESAAISRADAILAIEEGEAEQFRRYTKRPVYCVPHVPECVAAVEPGVDNYQLLIVASGNPINVQGVRWFIANVYSKVRVIEPRAKLSIVGDVCNNVGDLAVAGSNVKLRGRVRSLGEPYAAASVVVNPVLIGTGLCIKSIEALAHGRPLVSTTSGARGIASEAGIFVADDPAAMADHIVHLLQSPDIRRAAAVIGQNYLKSLKNTNRELLRRLLNAEAT